MIKLTEEQRRDILEKLCEIDEVGDQHLLTKADLDEMTWAIRKIIYEADFKK